MGNYVIIAGTLIWFTAAVYALFSGFPSINIILLFSLYLEEVPQIRHLQD